MPDGCKSAKSCSCWCDGCNAIDTGGSIFHCDNHWSDCHKGCTR